MTSTVTELLLAPGADPVDLVVERFGRWAHRYPAKELARRFDCSLSTAEGWRQGRTLPQARHMVHMVAQWGPTFLDFVYAPVLEDADLDRRLEACEQMLAAVRKEIRRAAASPLARATGPQGAHMAAGTGDPTNGGDVAAAGAVRAAGAAHRRAGPLVAAARAVVVAAVIGCGLAASWPHLPQTVADLVAEQDWARLPRGAGDWKRAPQRHASARAGGRRIV